MYYSVIKIINPQISLLFLLIDALLLYLSTHQSQENMSSSVIHEEYYEEVLSNFQAILSSSTSTDDGHTCSDLESIKDLFSIHRQVLLEILVANQYIDILKYLSFQNDPPLISSSDVIKNDLFSFLVEEGDELYHREGVKQLDPDMFRFLLDLDPSAVGHKFGRGNYIPFHIFAKFVALNIEDDEEFFKDLQRLLFLGIEYRVGDVDGISGFGGLFLRRQGSKTLEAPISTLFHHFKYRYRCGRMHHLLDSVQFTACIESLNVRYCLLEGAVMSEVGLCFVDDILERQSNLGKTRNSDGRLPLHYAIGSKVMEGFALNTLIRENFSALDEVDPITGFLPFILAASTNYDTNEGFNRGLDIVYNLLRQRPLLPHTAAMCTSRQSRDMMPHSIMSNIQDSSVQKKRKRNTL